MNVWIVEEGEYEERHLDSIWASPELAALRAEEINKRRALYRDRVHGERNVHKHPPCSATCELIADGADVIECKVEGLP